MKHNLRHLCVLSCLAVWLSAHGQWTLDGKTYNVDTLALSDIHQGITETHLHLTGPSSIHVFLLTIDLQTPGISPRAFTGKDRPRGLERISTVMKRATEQGHRYLCGVNADFFYFDTYLPVGAMVIDGEIINSGINNSHRYLCTDKSGKPYLTNATRNTCALFSGRDTMRLGAINRAPGDADGPMLYTSAYAEPVGGKDCTTLVLSADNKRPLSLGRKKRCHVLDIESETVFLLQPGQYAICCGKDNAEMLQRMAQRGRVDIKADMTLSGISARKVRQMVGGNPMLLHEGKPVLEDNSGLVVDLHPRTAVGHSADRKTMVLMVVDGRRSDSAGMTCPQLADAMRQAGCTEALNLDGGGSSTLWTSEGGVRNVTSDGHERAVANGFGFISGY